ncbi:MAG: glycosyltransferase family 2 protein [Acidimicrobiales bacterium]
MIDTIGVAIPVHQEQARLGASLAALHAATRALGGGARVDVAVVLDACRDGSAEIAARWQQFWAQTLPRSELLVATCDETNVGAARRVGFELLLERAAPVALQRLWLASTDADSQVPRHWLAHQARLAQAGTRAWAGTVRPELWLVGEGPEHHERRFWMRYHAGPGPGHPHVHGANFACDAEIYRDAGGFAPLVTAEDHALHAAIQALGITPRADRGAPVRTSSRLVGRAPAGFAAELRRAVTATPAAAPARPTR